MDEERPKRKNRSEPSLGDSLRLGLLLILSVPVISFGAPIVGNELITRLHQAKVLLKDANHSNPRRDLDPGIGGPGRTTIPSGHNR